jgi:hypothetical protein
MLGCSEIRTMTTRAYKETEFSPHLGDTDHDPCGEGDAERPCKPETAGGERDRSPMPLRVMKGDPP